MGKPKFLYVGFYGGSTMKVIVKLEGAGSDLVGALLEQVFLQTY